MKTLAAALVVLVACGGSPAPVAKAPPPADPAPPQEPVATPAPAEKPAEPAPPPAAPEPPPEVVLVPARAGDAEGPIPGMAGYAIKRKDDKTYCTGVAISMTRAKKPAKGDEKLAAVFAFDFPTGLDFSEKKKAASTKKFEKWFGDFQKASGDAVKHYEMQLANGDDAAKVVAMARIAQIYQRLAVVLNHAALPPDIRTGDMVEEKILAYCDTLAEVANPLENKATEAIKVCAEKVKGVPAGWWNDVCAVVQK